MENSEWHGPERDHVRHPIQYIIFLQEKQHQRRVKQMCINVQRFESTSFLFPHHDDIEYGECVVEIANSTSTTFDQIVWIIFLVIFPSCTRVVKKKFFSTKIIENKKK